MTAPADVAARAGALLDKYQVPPFSVLDTRQGYWQEARRAWLALGIRSELGRGFNADGGALGGGTAAVTNDLRVNRKGQASGSRPRRTGKHGNWMDTNAGRPAMTLVGLPERQGQVRALPDEPDWLPTSRREADQSSNVTGAPELPEYANFGTASVAPGTSIFDPVLCELAYRWWCPPGGTILDPFAGGSVRGIVASWLGHPYTGVDLSASQVASNREQAVAILSSTHPEPDWIVGDSRQVIPTTGTEWADFVFTCPPYYDLEVYSDDPNDLSAMADWPMFLDAYSDIIGNALAALKRDRFAAIVVSEIRGRDGIFRGLVPQTIRQFELHGARFYNEAVLINPAGTLPMRIGRQFDASRKLGRSHQNILVFVKGDVPRTHEWDYDRAAVPAPQLEMFDIPSVGADGRPL